MLVTENKGFILLELALSIFLLSIIIFPLTSLLINSVKIYSLVKEETEAIFLSQSILESLWGKDYPLTSLTSKNEEFIEHPDLPDYEYQLFITPYSGNTLYEITIILRSKIKPHKKIFLRTLEARGTTYEF